MIVLALETNWKHGLRHARVMILDNDGQTIGECVFDDAGRISPFQSEGYLKQA